MAHGFLTPQSVSGDRFWENTKDLYNLYKRVKDLLAKKQGEQQEKGGGLATTQKGGIIDENVKAVRVTDVSASKAQRNTPPAARMLRQSAVSGALKPGVDSIVKKEQLALPPGGPKLPGGASPSKGGTFTNIPGVSAAPKKLDSEAFFKAAQTGVDPETGRYLSSEERKSFLKKSKSQLNATASVASAAAPGISSASSLMTKGDEAVVGSVDNLTNVVSSLVDTIKSQTAAQKQISDKETAKAESLANRALARDEEKLLEQGTDNSSFITPTGGIGSPSPGSAGGGGMGGIGGARFLARGLLRGGHGFSRMSTGARAASSARTISGASSAAPGASRLGMLGRIGGFFSRFSLPALGLSVWGDTSGQENAAAEHLKRYGTRPGELYAPGDLNPDGTPKPGAQIRMPTGNYARGGLVTGGKKSVVDDVPIRADEGEVVMSNSAGNAWGRGTLLAMNAMGGGANKPTGGKGYAEGGLVGGDKAKSKQMFKLFGEGMIDAQKANSRDFAKIQSQGLRQYYQNEGGGDQLGKSLVKIFSKVGGILGSLFSGTLTSLLGGSAQAAPSGNPADYLSGDTSSLASFIGGVESGNDYTKLVGGKTDANILNKTVSELNAEKGGQFAMGRYQIQMRTAIGALKKAGIDPSKFKFDQAGQDKLFQLLLEGRGYKDFMSGKLSKEQFAKNLSMEWAALPKDASGLSYYHGDGKNKAHRGWGDTLQQLDQLKASGTPMGNVAGGPESQYNVTGAQKITRGEFGNRGFRTRDGLGSGASAFGHTGRDVGLPSGTPLSVVPPGTVIDASTGNNGGYGNFVAIRLDDGRIIKSNHHSKNLVKTGDRVGLQSDGSVKPFALVGSTGLSTGPHMHLDLGTGYNKSSAAVTGLQNPDNFILAGGIVKGGKATKASIASNDKGPTPPDASRSNTNLIGGGGQGGGRSSRRRAPAPAASPANRATGNDVAAASAFYTSGMRNTRGGGNTTVITNSNNGTSGSGSSNSAGAASGSSGMGALSALRLRVQ